MQQNHVKLLNVKQNTDQRHKKQISGEMENLRSVMWSSGRYANGISLEDAIMPPYISRFLLPFCLPLTKSAHNFLLKSPQSFIALMTSNILIKSKPIFLIRPS